MQDFLETIQPPLRNLDQIVDQLKSQDVQISDLFDSNFCSQHLSACGIEHVGTQLRILRAVQQRPSTMQAQRRRPVEDVQDVQNVKSMHDLDNASAPFPRFPPIFPRVAAAPSHVGLGLSVATIESLQSPYLLTISAILTPVYRKTWRKFSKIIGKSILDRVKANYKAIPLKRTFELPVILNMLLQHNPRGSWPQPMDLDSKNVVSHLLPQSHDPTYSIFQQASEFDVEAMVLVFDLALLNAYDANPHHLALAMEESVAMRLLAEEEVSRVATTPSLR